MTDPWTGSVMDKLFPQIKVRIDGRPVQRDGKGERRTGPLADLAGRANLTDHLAVRDLGALRHEGHGETAIAGDHATAVINPDL